MYPLVDYDNIPRAVRTWGVDHVVRRLVASIESFLGGADNSLHVRLYGGWLEATTFTRAAQLLQAEIEAVSPLPVRRADGGRFGIARVQLALSLLIDPSIAVTHTFRRKGPPAGIQCEGRPWINCATEAECPLRAMHSFISDDVCPNDRCGVGPGDILFKQEQKLVDTMLVADVLKISSLGEVIVIVSSDDDVWPGVHSAVLLGSKVLHVRTRGTTSPLKMYKRLPDERYKSITLS